MKRRLASLAACLALAAGPATVGQTSQRNLDLPDLLSRELRANYFMTEALELFRAHRTLEAARRYVETTATEVQFGGLHEMDGEISIGYVSRAPETFVSSTLFFSAASDSLSTVHVLMSPGRASRALRFIDDAYATSETGGGRAHLLGVERLGEGAVRVLLRQRESDLGTLYSIDYTIGE